MTVRRPVNLVAIAVLLVPVPPVMAQGEGKPRDQSQAQLILQLSGALESSDRGSALLKKAPDEALAEFEISSSRLSMRGLTTGRFTTTWVTRTCAWAKSGRRLQITAVPRS
jgi:hypothetical protein